MEPTESTSPEPPPAAAVRPSDLLHAFQWLADAMRVELDVDAAGAAVGDAPLRVGTPQLDRALARGLAACGLSAITCEIRVRDAGRRGTWVWVGPAGIVCVDERRLGRARVRTVHRGEFTERWMTPRALAALLGVADPSTVVRGVAPAPTLPLEPAVANERPLSTWRRGIAMLSIDRDDAWSCVIYGIAVGLLSLVTPIAIQSVVNTVSFGAVLQPLFVLTVLLAIGLAFSSIVRVLQAYVVENLQQRMLVRAVADGARRLVCAEVPALQRLHAPELSHRLFELPSIQKGVAVLFVDGIDLLLKLIVGMSLLTFYHPVLFAFALALIIAIAIVIFVPGRGATSTALAESTAKHEAALWLESLARMPYEFRSMTGRRWAIERADRAALRYRDARRRHFSRLLRHLVGSLGIKVLGATLLLGVGGSLVMSNQLTLGQLVAAELVFASISAALIKLHKQLEVAYDTMVSAHKLGLILDLPQERWGGELATGEGPAAVTLRGVDVVFDGRPALSDLHLEIPPRQHLGVTGPGGSGKSTLLDVMATMRPVTSGRVEIDGNDTRLLDLAALRRDLVLVREPEMVRGTVLDNLRLLRRDADLHEIEEVVEIVGLSDVLGSLPDGLATELTPAGRPLSRTQTRRLALARALLAQPRLLLLDEALDDLGIDEAATDRICAYVLRAEAPWTAIVASRTPAVLAACTRCIELGSSRIGGGL